MLTCRARGAIGKSCGAKKPSKTWIPVKILLRKREMTTGDLWYFGRDPENRGELKSRNELILHEKYTLLSNGKSKHGWEILIEKILNRVNFRYQIKVIYSE